MKNLSISEILEAISNLNMIEINKLIQEFEKKFNLSNDLNSEEVEKNKFNVYLKTLGNNKINLIKLVKELTNLSLKESKDLVESKNPLLKSNISKSECEELTKKFASIGSQIEFK